MPLDFLKDVVVASLTPFYDAATLHKITLTDNGKGGLIKSDDDVPCLAMVDTVTDRMREEEGYAATDVAVYILQTIEAEVKTDDEITVGGQRLRLVGAVIQDPVKSAWLIRGTPADG